MKYLHTWQRFCGENLIEIPVRIPVEIHDKHTEEFMKKKFWGISGGIPAEMAWKILARIPGEFTARNSAGVSQEIAREKSFFFKEIYLNE